MVREYIIFFMVAPTLPIIYMVGRLSIANLEDQRSLYKIYKITTIQLALIAILGTLILYSPDIYKSAKVYFFKEPVTPTQATGKNKLDVLNALGTCSERAIFKDGFCEITITNPVPPIYSCGPGFHLASAIYGDVPNCDPDLIVDKANE